jgi:hypothetical protein
MATSLVATGHLLYNSRHLCNASKGYCEAQVCLGERKIQGPFGRRFFFGILVSFLRNSGAPEEFKIALRELAPTS